MNGQTKWGIIHTVEYYFAIKGMHYNKDEF